ncbi:MAG: cell division protein FtsQ/DivIB [Gammaproteobacteria bacterium]|nr:cell division protein FtsQ/DivIB [Gammaproteobacteria bacterium]
MSKRINKNRRKEELRQGRRKVIRMFVAVLLFIAVGALGVVGYLKMADTDYLPIRFVKVNGDFKYLNAGELKKILNKELNKSFFNVDIDEIQMSVKQVPWVDQVVVHRSWPDTLVINIVEQRPLARWNDSGYVNLRGEWFLAEQKKTNGQWPVLEGPKGSEYFLSKEYLQVSNQLKKLGLSVKKLTVNHRRSWKLNLDNGLNIELGRMQVKLRLQRFLNVYRKVIAKQLQKIERVDMRYTNGFAVKWKAESDKSDNKKEVRNNV